jgi:hypothetical protein
MDREQQRRHPAGEPFQTRVSAGAGNHRHNERD